MTEQSDRARAASKRADADWLFSQNLAVYTGQWVAVLDHTMLAHGSDLKRVFADAMKKAGDGRPLFYSVPSSISSGA